MRGRIVGAWGMLGGCLGVHEGTHGGYMGRTRGRILYGNRLGSGWVHAFMQRG